MRHCIVLAGIVTMFAVGAAAGQETGDAKRGGEVYRACVACHSLEPDAHLTGPSLAGVLGREEGAPRATIAIHPA